MPKQQNNKQSNSDSERGHRARSLEELTKQNVETIAKLEEASHVHRTFGQRVADGVANSIGSWTFIITQSAILTVWMTVNAMAWFHHWDEYPYILLNLGLSFQAAFAGPIIMMSQNRQQRMAERRNHLDLQINLLAEQEATEILRVLRLVCERLDIPVADHPEDEALVQRTKPDRVVAQIEKSVEAAGNARENAGNAKPAAPESAEREKA